MARAKFISEEEMSRNYELANGDIITLKLDEEFEEITFWNEENIQLGSDRDFLFIEDDAGKYLLGRMYVPMTQNGLGRAALEFFIDYTDATVYAREHDGITRDDGSHLTGDAPIFVSKMKDEGLLQ